jgi:virginiamycin B lyase
VPTKSNFHGFDSVAFDSTSRTISFVEHNGNKIGRLSPNDNTITEWTIQAKSNDLFGPTSDFSGNIYFVEHNGNKIGRLSPNDNTITEWAIPTNSSGPTALAFDPSSGSLYFLENNTNKIGRLVLSTNSFTEWPVNKSISGMYVAPTGNLYFADKSGTLSRFS